MCEREEEEGFLVSGDGKRKNIFFSVVRKSMEKVFFGLLLLRKREEEENV